MSARPRKMGAACANPAGRRDLSRALLPLNEGIPGRGLRRVWRALMLSGAAMLAGCAANSYAGIPLADGVADPELQRLARRAQSGDRQAQLELGIRYEEGRGLPADLERARQLYRRASASADNSRMAYVPGTGGRPGSWTILSSGGRTGGLEEASLRLLALDPRSADRRVSATVVEAGVAEPEVCIRLQRMLSLLYGSPPAECAAYPFQVRPRGGRQLTAYDLVVSIPPEIAAQRDYPTNLVDPIQMALIDRSDPVRGRLTFYVVPTSGGEIPVIHNFEPER